MLIDPLTHRLHPGRIRPLTRLFLLEPHLFPSSSISGNVGSCVIASSTSRRAGTIGRGEWQPLPDPEMLASIIYLAWKSSEFTRPSLMEISFFFKKGRTGCGVGGASLGAVSNFMPRWSCGANLRVVVPQSPSSLSVKRSTPNSPQRAALHFPACPLLNLISINQEFPINTQKMGIRKIRHPCCLPYRSVFNFLG